MTNLKDSRRSVSNLRKQFLKIKGKLWVKAKYIDTNGRTVTKLSDSGAEIMSNRISQKRATFNAITKGIKLTQVENGFSSNAKVVKIIDWGVKYGNDQVTVKRFKRRGKYYTGTWVKGNKGMVSQERYSYTQKSTIRNLAAENELTYDNNIWDNEF